MRWVILTDDALPQLGGIATWTEWARSALAQQHEVQVFARARPGVRATPVAGPSFGTYGPIYVAVRAQRALRAADRVLATTWPMARWARHLSRAPIDVVAHGSDVTCHSGPLLRRVWQDAGGRWAVSTFLVDTLARQGIEATPLPVPIPPQAQRPLGSRWLFVGRAIHQKGGDRFVRLAAAARQPADLVGDGPALARWKRLAAELRAPVCFHGALTQAELEPLFRTARAVFLLSRPAADGAGAEGLGLTLLEGRVRGRPAVGCRTGGIPEAVGGGILLDAPDDPVHSVAQLTAQLPTATVGPLRHSPHAFCQALA